MNSLASGARWAPGREWSALSSAAALETADREAKAKSDDGLHAAD